MNGYEWVACSAKEFGPSGNERHLIRNQDGKRDLVTVCGHSASVPGIWRANSTKPMCRLCENSKVNR